MSKHTTRRQKQLARREAKRKQKRSQLARVKHEGLAEQLQRAAAAPILDCCLAEEIWDCGIGAVLLSRQLADGRVAFAQFLLDLLCLGVKDAHGDVVPRGVYREQVFGQWCKRSTVVDVEPEFARKLVEDAVDYAADLGIRPHPDYEKARRLLGDIDAKACDEEFEFGLDGKPHFFAGPYDSEAKIQRILRQLKERCGEGNFCFTVPVSGDPHHLEVTAE